MSVRRYLAMSGTLARYSAVRGFGNTIRWPLSIPWPSPNTASVIFLSSATFARNAVSPWTIVSRRHRVDRDHRLFACVGLHLNHPETLKPRRRSVDIAGGQQVGHEILRHDAGRVDNLLVDAQTRRQLEIEQVLLDSAGLRPNLADISPVGYLSIDQHQRLHHLPGTLGRPIAADGQNHQLVLRYSQVLADRFDFQVITAMGHIAVRAATHRKHLNVVSLDAVPNVDILHPVGGDQDQRQSVQNVPIFRDETIRHQPWDRQHSKLLRVQDQVRNMAPIPHAHHNVRPKPAVVPFLFQGRFEMYRVNVHADFAQTPAQKIALHRQAARRWWIVEQHKHLHVFSSSNAVRITAACAESKHRKPSSRGVLRASQLSAPYP